MKEKDLRLEEIVAAKKMSFKNPTGAFEICERIYKESQTEGDAELEGNALIGMALACRSMTKLSECFDYASDAYRIFEKLDDKVGLAGALNLMGVVYYYYAMFEQAIEYFMKALEFMAQDEDPITVCRLYNNIGEVYQEIGSYGQALDAYQKAFQISQENGYQLITAIILENLGEIHFKRENLDDSFRCYMESYEILKENDDITALAEVENRIGKIYFSRGDLETAKKFYDSALKKLNDLNNRYFTIDVLTNLAEMEMDRNENSFVEYAMQAIRDGEEINARLKLSGIYLMVTNFYEKKKDYKAALEFFRRYHMMEKEVETSIISHKLEIYRIELSKLNKGNEVEKITTINKQLESEITHQKDLLKRMEKANRNLSVEVLLDELTGIANRRGVNRFLHQQKSVMHGNPGSCAMFMLDIDYFKRYNDTYGHPKGDICLKRITSALSRVCNPIFEKYAGILGRYGGEEFICYCGHLSREESVNLAEAMRKSILEEGITYEWEKETLPVTISIGIAWAERCKLKENGSLYELADKALYISKAQGRNQVTFLEMD